MVDFRYHLVSIVAVFLALALGIVLGSTELRGTAFNVLDRASSALSAKLSSTENQNSALQQQVAGATAFAQAEEPTLLAHLLQGRQVVLVTEPGAPADVVTGMRTALGDAGATVSGQVALRGPFFASGASELSLLDQLTARLAPSGTTLGDGTPAQRAAQLLATAILPAGAATGTGSGNGSGGSAAVGGQGGPAHTILSGYAAAGFLTVTGHPASGATLAVVVTGGDTQPGGPSASPTGTGGQALVSLAGQLAKAGKATVVVGSTAESGPGSDIASVRSSSVATQASTVDDADTVDGQIVAVQALAAELAGRKPASYGTQPDAGAIGPSPAPTAPAATPTANARANTSTRSKAKP